MLRALFVAIIALVSAGSALAAADIVTCRDPAAQPEARLVACSAMTADDSIAGKPRAAAYQVIGDSFMKKRDYDSAITAFGKAHDADPDNVGYINSRGIAYSWRGNRRFRHCEERSDRSNPFFLRVARWIASLRSQ
jgi:tetratricopeptide (TPR) repeat protein